LDLADTGGDWRLALQRLDDKNEYLQSNCVLVAREFVTRYSPQRNKEVLFSAQWNKEKIDEVADRRYKPVDLEKLQALIEEARNDRPEIGGLNPRLSRRAANERGEWQCCVCREWKPKEAFGSTPQAKHSVYSVCYSCKTELAAKRRRTLRGSLMQLLQNVRFNLKKAESRGEAKPTMTLSIDDVLDLLWKQQGRCSHSHVPLEYLEPGAPYRLALERVDLDRGFTPDNVVLIALEFSTNVGPLRDMHSRWSRQKVESVWGPVDASRLST